MSETPRLKRRGFLKRARRGIASPLPLHRIHPRHKWRGILREFHKLNISRLYFNHLIYLGYYLYVCKFEFVFVQFLSSRIIPVCELLHRFEG